MTEQNKRETELLDKLEELSNDSEVDMYSVATLNAYFEECKDVISGLLEEIQQYRAIGLTPELIEAMQGHNIAMINDLEAYQAIGTVEDISKGIQQSEEEFDMLMEYRNIGTVEELQALKEKSVAKKPIEQGTDDKTIYKCSCGNVLMEKYSDGLICGFITDYCEVCGQKLLRADVDWE